MTHECSRTASCVNSTSPRECGLQSSAVATQTTRVQRLELQAATGKVSVTCLKQEQSVLSKMTVSTPILPLGLVFLHE